MAIPTTAPDGGSVEGGEGELEGESLKDGALVP